MLGMRAYRRALRRAARHSWRRHARRSRGLFSPWRRRARRRVWRGLARSIRLARGVATLLILGAVVYKLTNRDVERIEQATGKRAEDLSEAEMENALESLGIEPLDLDDADEQELQQYETRRLDEREPFDLSSD